MKISNKFIRFVRYRFDNMDEFDRMNLQFGFVLGVPIVLLLLGWFSFWFVVGSLVWVGGILLKLFFEWFKVLRRDWREFR